MESVRKIYRFERDMSDIIEVIAVGETDKPKDISVEKLMSAILHKIITQQGGDGTTYESEE